MSSEGSLRSVLGEEVAVAELRAGAGTRFDAHLVSLFLEALERVQAPALPQAS
jgi:HD-GYP domain-containing protein (c-di-GMP phosphodiesterase class II)